MQSFNFVPYAFRSPGLYDSIRLHKEHLQLGPVTYEKLGSPPYIHILVDTTAQVIKLEPAQEPTMETRKPSAISGRRKGAKSGVSWRVSVVSLSGHMPEGRYHPVPDEPLVFKFEGGS